LRHQDVGGVKVRYCGCGPDPLPLACSAVKWPVPPPVKFK